MAFGNYFTPPGYNPGYYPPPMQDQLAQLRNQPYNPPPYMQQNQPNINQPNNGTIWVQGEEGAKAYMVAAGNSVFLMDSESPTFYLKSVDASGIPMPLRIFDYQERTAQNGKAEIPNVKETPVPAQDFATRMELQALEAKLNDFMNAAQASKVERKITTKNQQEDLKNGKPAL